MKLFSNVFLGSILFFSIFKVNGQYEEPYGGPINVPLSTNNEESDVIDGVYVKTIVPSRSMIRYEHVRESDVVWSRRVWSYIDLREKINHPLYFPHEEMLKITNQDFSEEFIPILNTDRLSLWSIIKEHILKGDMTCYAVSHPRDQAYDEDGQPIRITTYDNDGNVLSIRDSLIPEEKFLWYTSKDIIQYRLKEDWFFDKERSVLDVRILGIWPVIYNELKPGAEHRDLFWLYFPHLRPYLSRYYTYNEQNDAQWMSFDDLFFKRRFNAVMYKETNVYDRSVESYRMGADALMEAEKIKEKIRTLEHDVWNF
jgi:gliding motility associated protien GldN